MLNLKFKVVRHWLKGEFDLKNSQQIINGMNEHGIKYLDAKFILQVIDYQSWNQKHQGFEFDNRFYPCP